MPELPEVETIRRQLEKQIVGQRINSVDVFFSGRINFSAKKFREHLRDKKIISVSRRAKLLLINLSDGFTLVIHLKMSGQLLLVGSDRLPDKHTHLVFNLSGDYRLFFTDVRKFGFVRIFKTSELEQKVFHPAQFGVEPQSADFTLNHLTDCLLRHSRSAIKPLLLSQKCVVGVGNIYSDETLWRARIRPSRLAGQLKPDEIKRLYSAIKQILTKSIELGGTSVDQYRDTTGARGGYARLLKVYGRTGLSCRRCQHPIKKIRLGGRGTHWCPGCQR
ncbi:bifunctional DNA-formamidopyrimidine glycosylase/DNA-(apurinic or apyrimidinic site) lyase [Patescibacteria group bacterium]|nr:bifunctional DNA-formamidopyrimidine glycosylase/DNA-(apurinic or apyrimidinic site) lyase [Patescibacteria group bacterium]MBU1029407.1 bifunctional DNA-formamidopyrimidine glycosylase/DNA-(apurinic or apyrimidinic site) lyase [Patescibacteria group bacterium]MBU1915517.1 bifunctional DNA-formamidopyrimidine glycosylase/DNA-(apurinic or apyrimidinic site) lyase [Patescibacteria group bacterium]